MRGIINKILVVALLISMGICGTLLTQSDTPALVKEVLPTAVHINSPGQCQGSGCIISPDGIIFTAKHVTDGLHNDYRITLNDGREFGVTYVIEDRENDLAFMKLDLPPGVTVPYARLDRDDELEVGEDVLIIGSSLGKSNFNTVSKGIVSYVGRDFDVPDQHNPYSWHAMVQSTSPAFPGNSGGPVFNMDGEVIGVLVAGADATLNYSVPVGNFKENIVSIRTALELSRFMEVQEVDDGGEFNFYSFEEQQSWD